jgi:hypothetical protein
MSEEEIIKTTARIFLLVLVLVFGIMAWKSAPNTASFWVGVFGGAISLALFLFIIYFASKRK